MNRFRRLALIVIPLLTISPAPARADEVPDFPVPVNTQAAGEHPPVPDDMPDLFELPPGFHVTLFAGEPDVRQPIAFEFDDRGRVWVAENYTYSAYGAIDPDLRDRIVVLADNDGDGRHDERRVFYDQGRMLTGLTWGRGGLWILNDGTLSFIPDRDGDLVPDSEPVVILDGWTRDAQHNVVNGLMWGPDGWLYGRHGILDTSYPGRPGTPKEDRTPINCGIWRFHPDKHTFEVVCHGTVNPWGMDYNAHGQLFMTNNVMAHLWHVIPGAHFERMFGQDFNPYLFELMGPCSEHYHWDTDRKWTESRDGAADELGGGHSHCGGMIYLGTQFPGKYRGRMFTCNTHGRCVNVDRLEQHGSSYVSKFEPNFLKVNTPWFRGLELREGPSGCVWLSDWSDNGECHDQDGVHRTSGRIYRISYGDDPASAVESASVLNDADQKGLAAMALESPSEWLRRRAARKLMETRLSGNVVTKLRDEAMDEENALRSLNAAWLLHATAHVDEDTCERMLGSSSEHLRSLAVRFISESPHLQANSERIVAAAQAEESPFVQMAWASGVRRLPLEDGAESLGRNVLISLVHNETLKNCRDPQLVRMLWYALESGARRGPPVLPVEHQTLLRWTIRRLAASNWNAAQRIVSELFRTATQEELSGRMIVQILAGLRDGLQGVRRVDPPEDWEQIIAVASREDDSEIDALIDELSVLFGDGVALEKLRELVAAHDGDHTARSQAIRVLAQARDEKSVPLLLSVLNDRAVYADAARALAEFDDPQIPKSLLNHWAGFLHGSREAALDTFCSRLAFAKELARAIEASQIDASSLTAAHVRQLLSFNDPEIRTTVESRWGIVRDSPAEKASMIAALKERLTDDVLSHTDRKNGAAVFKKTCANCHKLYGEGGTIGPDLTGANRTNMDYLLGNIIDPSAQVARQHTLSVIALTSGRVINGVVVNETEQSIVVQTDKELVTVAINEIEERRQTNRSLMPDGLFDALPPNAVRDLIAYLRHID